jgi:hypothetical protein
MPMNKPHLEFVTLDMSSGWATPEGIRPHQTEDSRERHRRKAQDGKPHAAVALSIPARTRRRLRARSTGRGLSSFGRLIVGNDDQGRGG